MALTMTGALVWDLSLRMRISRGPSLVLLFLDGYGVERCCGLRAVQVGLAMLGRIPDRHLRGAVRMRRWCAVASALVAILLSVAAGAQPGAEKGEAAGPDWSFGASLDWYFVLDQKNYPQPTVTVDRGALHLEARYNYEALRTASIFVGWNFELGETLKLGLTPMVGSVLGETVGPAMGLGLTLSWGPLGFSSQGEYVVARLGGTASFVYVWSELEVRPWEWLRAGMVVERTRVFHTPREVMLGPLLGVAVWKLNASFCWLDPAGPGQFLVASVGVTF